MSAKVPCRWAPRGAALIAVIALLSAAGCKSERKGGAVTETRAEQASSPQRGGHLVLPSNEPRYLNPVLETRFELANMLLFEGLVGLDARLEPTPRLAESWDVSPDGTTITFALRDGVSWHDGTPLSARDVAFTYEQIRSTEAPSLWKAYMSGVDRVETPDDKTVVVHYARPYGPALVTWTVGILPAHVFADGDLVSSDGNREPVGTGPYRLARWEPGKRLVLQANDAWWFGRPHIDTIELVVDVGQDEALDALRASAVDLVRVADVSEWIHEVQMPGFRDAFEVSDVIESRFRLIAWNGLRKPYDDARVRQALTYALNRQRVIDDVLLGQARPLSAPFFPNMFGADPSIAPYSFDLDRAVTLLNEAGHPSQDGRRFEIEMISLESQRGPTTDASMAIFRNDLRAIGVELKLTYLRSPEFFERAVLRDYDAIYFGWLPDIPDPDPYALLHSSQIGAGANYAGYSSPQVDELLDEARATADRDERRSIYHRLHRILSEEQPYTMLYAPYGHYVWNRRLRGVNPRDIGPQPRFPGVARWWIEPVTPGTAAQKAAR
jgi:peptide/nickel transport system substrate-binding protein